MQDLPVEILLQIFAYTCTDGRYSGRSLSLVARAFHDAVRAIRFHSVALTGARQIYGFLPCLEKARLLGPIPVRHLFISTWADGEEVARIREGSALRPQILPCYPALAVATGPPWNLWPLLQETLDARLVKRIPLLLQAVADDLISLSIVHSWEFGPIQLPPTFPLLQKLTICGPPPNFPTDTVNTGLPSPCFPRLRDLHVVCRNVSMVPWVFNSPAMIRLRLSDVCPSAARLPCQLRCILGCSSKSFRVLVSAEPYDSNSATCYSSIDA